MVLMHPLVHERRHLSGPHQLTPSPRGSFNSLVARALPSLTPGPDEVRLVV